MTHVIIFGDSIAYGIFDEAGGWVQRIRVQVDRRNAEQQGYSTLIYNLAISGDTTSGLLRRIQVELPARKESDSSQDNIVVFALGVNDSTYLVDEQCPRISDQEFSDNIRSLGRFASQHAARVVFIGLFLVDQAIVDPIPWAPEMAYRNALIRNFDGIIQNICNSERYEYVSLMSLWSENQAKQFLYDGVHPNAEGHRQIAEKVKELFQK